MNEEVSGLARRVEARKRETDGRVVLVPEGDDHALLTLHRHRGNPPGYGSQGQLYDPEVYAEFLVALVNDLLPAASAFFWNTDPGDVGSCPPRALEGWEAMGRALRFLRDLEDGF